MFKRATSLLALFATAVLAADFSVDVNYEGQGLYYTIYTNRTQNKSCTSTRNGVSFSANTLAGRTIRFYTDRYCRSPQPLATIDAEELFASGNDVYIKIEQDGTWSFAAAPNPGGPGGPG
ncbi:MAG: hypothetical protein IJ912_12015, partial [Fibrobacter sp.]|nr:hypothetical protein [Fibrobacter sp.]